MSIADQSTARPFSGEIMAAATAPAARPAPAAFDDIVDADYEIVSPPERDPDRSTFRAAAVPTAGGMAMLRRAGGELAARGPVRGGPIFWIFGMAAVAAAFWISGGHALVRPAAPQPAAALTISGVSSRIEAAGRNSFLYIDGHAANDGTAAADLPPLEIRVASNDGRVTRYNLGTSGRAMKPGDKFAFSSRLDVPKSGVKTVSVTFGE